MSSFILPPFSKDTPNKISNQIKISGSNTFSKSDVEFNWRVAIADEPIDAKIDGKKIFCVRVDNAGMYSSVMIGFTPMETLDEDKDACYSRIREHCFK